MFRDQGEEDSLRGPARIVQRAFDLGRKAHVTDFDTVIVVF
jgi:hypothetical protein